MAEKNNKEKCIDCKHWVYDSDCLETWLCERAYENKPCEFELWEPTKRPTK